MTGKQESLDSRTGPNWRAFGRFLAIGCLRRLGYLPMPKEVRDRLVREGKAHLLPDAKEVDSRDLMRKEVKSVAQMGQDG